jgi:hypothetical protein
VQGGRILDHDQARSRRTHFTTSKARSCSIVPRTIRH